MARINSFNDGFIIVNGEQYVYDVVILPDGTVKEREASKSKIGSHKITESEIENLLMTEPDVILLGTGASGNARLSRDAETYVQQPNLNLVTLPTASAVARFNQLSNEGKRVAALIHITC